MGDGLGDGDGDGDGGLMMDQVGLDMIMNMNSSMEGVKRA